MKKYLYANILTSNVGNGYIGTLQKLKLKC